MIMIYEGCPGGIVCSIPHQERRAGHINLRAQPFVHDQAAGGVQSCPPVVGATKIPFQYGQFDMGIVRSLDIVAEVNQVIVYPL